MKFYYNMFINYYIYRINYTNIMKAQFYPENSYENSKYY